MSRKKINPLLEDRLALWFNDHGYYDKKNFSISIYGLHRIFSGRRHIKDIAHLRKALDEGERKGYWQVTEGRQRGSIKIVL